MRRRLQSGDFEAIYTETERIPKRDDKAERYRSIAGLCSELGDKFNAFRAANRYLELSENNATAYQFIGYIYWWFKDTDTAIVHTERALQIAKTLHDGSQQAEIIRKLENNLAFYYAEKGINKDEALSLAERSVKDLAKDHEYYVNLMDTAGYVHLKFGTTAEEFTKAIDCFDLVLDTAPQTKDTLLHLQEAWMKKRELKKQAEVEKV